MFYSKPLGYCFYASIACKFFLIICTSRWRLIQFAFIFGQSPWKHIHICSYFSLAAAGQWLLVCFLFFFDAITYTHCWRRPPCLRFVSLLYSAPLIINRLQSQCSVFQILTIWVRIESIGAYVFGLCGFIITSTPLTLSVVLANKTN